MLLKQGRLKGTENALKVKITSVQPITHLKQISVNYQRLEKTEDETEEKHIYTKIFDFMQAAFPS